jgi:hypothetical protein
MTVCLISIIHFYYFSEGDIYDLATSGAGTAYPSGAPEFTPRGPLLNLWLAIIIW